MTEVGDLFATVLTWTGAAETGPTDVLQVGAGERVVAIGDSITENGGYLRAIDAVLARHYGDLGIPAILNAGISGQKAEDLVERFQRDVVDRRPAVATLSVGINDVWHRLGAPDDDRVLEAFAGNVGRMAQMGRDAGIRMFLLAPTVIEENPRSEGNRRLARYVEAGRDVARRSGCDYVDLHGLFLRAIAGRAKQAGNPQRLPSLTRDGVHMEPPGDALMAVGVLRSLGVPDGRIVGTDLTGVLAWSA